MAVNMLCDQAAQGAVPTGVSGLTGGVSGPAISAADTGLRWHVLQTKSRQEKALSETLNSLKIKHFLPIVQVQRMHGGRKAKVELPLFPGYLFLHGTLDEAYTADRTKRVAKVIPVFDQIRLGEELRSLEMAINASAEASQFDPFPYLKSGIRVEVVSGPLRGVRGVIEDRRKRDRLILQVDVLGQATSVEVDSALLVPIGEF
ncbi:MAG TPA: transcription termination/antitermination NusG family protein [Phycisphaerae bacterium]|nr:transcription termination/antitermination NusG family protein [Phycisphaerae bacterium]